jgi:hypothetical protein
VGAPHQQIAAGLVLYAGATGPAVHISTMLQKIAPAAAFAIFRFFTRRVC